MERGANADPTPRHPRLAGGAGVWRDGCAGGGAAKRRHLTPTRDPASPRLFLMLGASSLLTPALRGAPECGVTDAPARAPRSGVTSPRPEPPLPPASS